MGLHWGVPALQSLLGDELWSGIKDVQVDPSTPLEQTGALKFVNAKTGDLLTEIPVSNWYRLKRSALRTYLAEPRHGLEVIYNKRLDSISFEPTESGKAKATFADGSTLTANMIVGADGPRSRVRDILVGNPHEAASRRLPFVACYIQARFTAEQALHLRSFHPLYLAGVHPSNQFSFFGLQDVPDPNDPSTWLFFYYISAPLPLDTTERRSRSPEIGGWTTSDWLAEAKSWAREYADPWRSAFEWTPNTSEVWTWTFSEWDPSEPEHAWNTHSGRATLAGDAAHGMTIQRGQGLNHSVTDALHLRDAVIKAFDPLANKKDIIAEYELEMKTRTGEEVRLCTMNTTMLHNWEKVRESPVFKKGMKRGDS
jgi:2-polyprenyl-6-methoxyphenol hydroxylase-like FAD-dependent oxidoreductase